MPDAAANFVGRMQGEIWRNASQADRTHVEGKGVLKANFAQSAVNGEIKNIAARPEASTRYSSLENNRFIIETGNIENGRFTSNLKGADDASGESGAQRSNDVIASVEGFDGSILGEFFGPQADEVGAVLNATRGDAVLYGNLTGVPFNPAGPIQRTNFESLDVTLL